MRQNGLAVLAAFVTITASTTASANEDYAIASENFAGAYSASKSTSDYCTGKVTEVTVNANGLVATRTNAIVLGGGKWWVPVCNLETEGNTCNGMLSSLQTAVASGSMVVFKVDIGAPVEGKTCAGSTAQIFVDYVKLHNPPYVE